MTTGKRVALALGSGGARGYAHIGAIQVLEERGYEIVTVAGTSMGSVIGGLYAAGRLEAYTEWVSKLGQRDVWRLLDPALTGPGAIRAERVMAKVAEILDGALIEDLQISFTAVATDLDHRREVWFQRGPVITAMRASISIPTVITPIVVDGRILVDGGVINPVPIEPTTAIATDLTVAISLSALPPASGGGERPTQSVVRDSGAGTLSDLTGRVRALSSRLWGGGGAPAADSAEAPDPTEAPESSGNEDGMPRAVHAPEVAPAEAPTTKEAALYDQAPKDLRTIDVMNRSLDTMAALITRYRMASNPPDVLVNVPADACGTMDFHRAAEMIELGRELTIKALDAAGR